MTEPVIVFDRVWKSFRRGESATALRDAVPVLFRRLIRSRSANKSELDTRRTFWALKDISFEVKRGETFGIIGPNGAGKTTILSLIAGILRQKRGQIRVNGRVAALIHLSAGFHPDLTGRENIYLNASIMGMSREEINAKFSEILAFSELEGFIDTPVKRYSSGMYARLGFSVAAHVDSDILLVDEILSVGDMGFQQKSFEKIHSLTTSGRTVVLVSHYLGAIETFCERTLWVDRGQIRMLGRTGDVIQKYLDHLDLESLKRGREIGFLGSSDGSLEITGVDFEDGAEEEKTEFQHGDDLVIRVMYRAHKRIPRPHFSLGVSDGRGGVLFLASMIVDGETPSFIEGEGVIACRFKRIPLLPKTYHLWGSVRGSRGFGDIIDWQVWNSFRVVDDLNGVLKKNGKSSITHTRADAPIHVPYEWDFTGGTRK